ncbi:MAG: WxL domain-containing protein [Bifidobacteriaceae bacterium]|jgi:hypothetical protein|nr:WxL domain-containing protein [Bifidobacteriaceae bacterium]
MFHNIGKKTLAAIAASVTAVGLAALPAAADDDPLRLGDLQVSPLSGQIDSELAVGWLEIEWTNPGEVCPAGFRTRTSLFPFVNGQQNANSTGRVFRYEAAAVAPNMGGILDGEDYVYRTGEYAALQTTLFPWNSVALTGGSVEMRHTCQAGNTYAAATDPYYSVFIEVEAGGAWHVAGVTVNDTSQSDINVNVPTAEASVATGLKISVKPGATTLTGPATRDAGQVWTATGTLDDVTVNDDRRDASGADWTLTGMASAFTHTTLNSAIPASNLGWTPAKVSGAGTAGPAVSTSVGLANYRTLATGAASAGTDVTTTVNAALALEVPATVAAGAYSATLTLTLI